MIVFQKNCICFLIIAAIILIAGGLGATETVNPEQKAPEVLSALTDSLVFTKPVVIDIRCGEWTPVLERELRKILLARNIDIREINFGLIKDGSDYLPLAMESDFGINGTMLLQMLDLKQAEYLELSLEQSIETGEKRNLISYSRYNMPVYRFVLKQIALPEQQLLALKEHQIKGIPEIENPGSLLAMKWYEPVLASAFIGSLIYMLWTLK